MGSNTGGSSRGGNSGWSASGGLPVDQRPDFMVYLELLPPYTEDDVHKAYKAKALKVHPDRGGSPDAFLKLQEAYQQAQEYVNFRIGRRHWMANQVEPYLKQQEVIQEVERRHGQVQVERVDWMQRSFGDFATLTERLRHIDLRDAADADEFLEFLTGNSQHLRFLTSLDLAGSQVTDAGLTSIRQLRSLQRLNLARTQVTAAGLKPLEGLSDLQWLNLGGVRIGWWSKWKLASRFRTVEIVFQPGG
ncbi:MAG: DnaJ domain-containing protein [Planctomycetales bacterium]